MTWKSCNLEIIELLNCVIHFIRQIWIGNHVTFKFLIYPFLEVILKKKNWKLFLNSTTWLSKSLKSFLEVARESLEEAWVEWVGWLSWFTINWRLACMEAIWAFRFLTSWERLFRTLGSTSTSSSPLVWRLVSSTCCWCWVLARVALLVLMVIERT